MGKQAGRELQPVATPRPSNVINLMDALHRAQKAGAAKSSAHEEQRAVLARGAAAWAVSFDADDRIRS
jgi:non-homologous end joining protein Ku